MKIAVIGASGWLGGTVLREAVARGHEVTAIARDPSRLPEGVRHVQADATDPQSIGAAVAGNDAVVAAVTDRSTPDRSVIPTAAGVLIDALPAAGVKRLIWLGGGGSLQSASGERFVDSPDFPDAYKAEALAQADALARFRAAGDALDWSYLSPPPHHLEAGDKQGGYRVAGGDTPVGGEDDRITAGDFASAAVDELEQPQFVGRRFTAAY
jgi:putative NADH-flavin reductase